MAIEMIIEQVKVTETGIFYRVLLDDMVLVSRTKDPEFNACRAYLALNPGSEDAKAVFRRRGEPVHLEMRIGYGAQKTASEGERKSLRIRDWHPVPDLPDGS
jgi:hypothetical protein